MRNSRSVQATRFSVPADFWSDFEDQKPNPPERQPRRRNPRAERDRGRLWRKPPAIVAIIFSALLLIGSAEGILRTEAERLLRLRRDEASAAIPVRVNTLPETEPLTQISPPAASGAYAPYPLNHTLDGDAVFPGGEAANYDFEAAGQTVGTSPSNYTFDSSPTNQGTQLTNYNFASGNFTGWTAGSGVTIQTSGGPDGDWARLTSSGALTSDAFTVESDAQAIVFDYGAFNTSGGNTIGVYILSGATYTTSDLMGTWQCANCNSWSTIQVGIGDYKGQSIKIKIVRSSGTLGVDRVTKQIIFPDFVVNGKVERLLDGSNPYAKVSDKLESSAFTVDSTAQQLTVKAKKGGTTGQMYFNVLSGSGYTTTTQFNTSIGTNWETFLIDISAFLGQSIKLQVDVITGFAAIDDIGIMRVEAPDWTVEEGTISRVDGGNGGNATSVTDQITSSAVTLPDNIQQVTIRYKTAASSFYWEMLTGAGFSTVVNLGTSVQPTSTSWTTTRYAISEYAGETVKFRIRVLLAAVTVDNVGYFESLLPGWQVLYPHAAEVGSDASGTYVTAEEDEGAIDLVSSVINPGVVDKSGRADSRSYLVGFTIGTGTSSQFRITYSEPDGSNPYVVLQTTAGTPDEYQSARFVIADFEATTGIFLVELTGGARLYSIGDNVARQQLGEPYSQSVGDEVDTSTGSFGTREVDLTVEGGPMPLVFARYYHGHSDRIGNFGHRWRHTYDTYLYIDSIGNVAVCFGSGREEFFEYSSLVQTYTASDPRIKSTLTTPPDQDYTYLYKTKDGTEYRFTGSGDLISIADRNGNQLTLVRDGSNRITEIQGPADPNSNPGPKIELTYDSNDRVLTAKDPDDFELTYEYDSAGDLVAVEGNNDIRTEYTYDKHRLIQVDVRTGPELPEEVWETVLTNTFDDYSRLIEQQDQQSNSISISYETPERGITRVEDRDGNLTDFYFDTWARTRFIDYPTDESRTFVFDTVGNMIKTVDATNRETEYEYDGEANVTDLTDPIGNPSSVEYNAQNLPLEFDDANGETWVFSYDLDGNTLTATNPLSNTWTYTYDSNGNKLTETDPLNNTWDFTFTNNRMTEKEDPLGNIWTYTYSAKGNMTSMTDPEGNLTEWSYSLGGVISGYTDPTGSHWAYTYDLFGQMIVALDPELTPTFFLYYSVLGKPSSKYDAEGGFWEYFYDENENITKQSDPNENVIAWEYDPSGKITRRIADPNPSGQTSHLAITTAYTYYPDGQVETVTVDPTDPDGDVELNRVTTYTYDDNGRLDGMELPNGGVFTYTYDGLGNRTSETDPLSRTTTYDYDIAGRLLVVTDPTGARIRYEYDDANRRTKVIVDPTLDPDGDPYGGFHFNLTTTTVYDAAGRIESVTSPTGKVTHYVRDGNGNPTTVTEDYGSGKLNLETFYEYDELGRAWRTTDALGRTTTRSYDTRGRTIQVIRGATVTDPGIVTTYSYDEMDRLLSTTVDPTDTNTPRVEENLVTTYTYDDAGQQTSITNPRGYTTDFEYDAVGRMTQIEDPLNGTVLFDYNAAGEIVELTNPRGKITTYTYDQLGNRLTQTDPLSRTWEWEYDLAGQLIEQTDAEQQIQTYRYWDDGQLRDIRDSGGSNTYVSYGYDAIGRQTSMVDVTGTTTWVYDTATGELDSVNSPQGNLSYTYDSAGRLDTLTSPGSRTVDYNYDAASQLIEVTDWQSQTTTFDYASTGALDLVTRPNGITTDYTYDYAGRLSQVEHADGGALLARYQYGLDDNGNRTGVSITGSAVTTGTESYTYDQLDRLVTASYPGGGSATYTYDPNGNRTSVTSGGVVTNYTIDDADQLTNLKDVNQTVLQTYGYDDNGNRTSSGSDSYSYDWNNRPVSASVSGATVTYTYAGDDLRTSRTIAGTTTTYLWDRETGLPEIIDDGTTVTVQSPIGTLGQFNASTGDGTYPLADGLGTARAQTDDTGAVIGTADYDAFGNVRASSGNQTRDSWAGESRDTTTGLTNLRARDYDPLTGRFTTADSQSPNGSFTQGYNAYHYTGNNPTTRTDPSGHNWLDGIGTAITQITDMIVGAIGVMHWVNNNDRIPEWGKKFIQALVIFAVQTFLMLLGFMLLSWVVEVSGLGDTMVGRAMILVRTNILGKMKALGDKCIASQACRYLPRWLIKNPDCLLEILTTAVSYAFGGTAGIVSMAGGVNAGGDAGFILKECLDKNPAGGGTPNGNTESKRGGAEPVRKGKAGEQRVREYVESSNGEVIGEQVTMDYAKVDGSSGTVRPDLVITTSDNVMVIIEVKTGSGSLTGNQRDGYQSIQNNGATVRGANGEGIPTGDGNKIPATQVCVVSGDDMSEIASVIANNGC